MLFPPKYGASNENKKKNKRDERQKKEMKNMLNEARARDSFMFPFRHALSNSAGASHKK